MNYASFSSNLNVSLRRRQLTELQDGWLDGKGLAPDRIALLKLGRLFEASFDSDLPLPFLYPTAEGGVQAEWDLGNISASLEIDLQGFEGAYHALDLRSGVSEESTFILNRPQEWIRLNETLKKLEKRDEGHAVEA